MSAQTGRPRLSTAEGRRLRVHLVRVAALAAGRGLLLEGILVLGGATALLVEAGLRAVEYAGLAAALAWLGRQSWGGVWLYLGLGAGIGIVFGLLIAAVLPPDSPLGWPGEELVFPTGCALVIFAAEILTRLLPEDTAPSTPA